MGDAPRISGFLIVRNGVRNGYPFLEAIQAALPVCDEFLVADGWSEDGTWDALQALRDAYPDRVELFRDRWVRDDERAIAAMTNVLRQRCRYEYCLNVQANEVVHEATIAQLRALPALYPHTEMFRLPFLNLMGRTLAWFVDFRRRLFRNRAAIVSRGDGFDVGYRLAALWREPARLRRYLLHRSGERLVYLRRPIYRYRGLGPIDFLVKLDTRRRQTGGRSADELRFASQLLQRVNPDTASTDEFWRAMRAYFETARFAIAGAADGPAPRRCLPEDDAGDPPALVRPLLDAWRYPLADSLARLPAAR
ncbi:MAG: hypothetical protein SF182_24910 [Deltaproteobacteria bacterium]|nr:hypothetical protein [Deltaproteobacteria bacterium]